MNVLIGFAACLAPFALMGACGYAYVGARQLARAFGRWCLTPMAEPARRQRKPPTAMTELTDYTRSYQ